MNLTIKNIRLNELENYINSKEYQGSSFLPISKIRAVSHIHNPRSSGDDCCLFLAYNKKQFIGYLGALTDYLFFEDSYEKVYWLSCMWVLPEYRRHGVALKLLKHAYDVFGGKVLITNYIPQSKKAFDKTGQYDELKQLKGIRAYFRFDLANILTRKNSKLKYVKPIIKLIDISINSLINLRLLFKSASQNTSCDFSEINLFDNSLSEYLQEKSKSGLFRRDAEQFSWMMNFPWVKKVKRLSEESSRYHFSQESKDFKQWFIKVTDQEKVVGFLMLNKNKGELRSPYLMYDNRYTEDIAGYIIKISIREGIRTYIGYNSTINSYLVRSNFLIKSKPSTYGFLISKKLNNQVNIPVNLYEGDGDGAFI